MQLDILDCCGAYGRKADYNDWLKGLDFKVIDGPYFSIRDCNALRDYCHELHFYKPGPEIAFKIILK